MRLDGVGPQDGLKGGGRVALDHLRSCREHILCTETHTGHPCTTHEVENDKMVVGDGLAKTG